MTKIKQLVLETLVTTAALYALAGWTSVEQVYELARSEKGEAGDFGKSIF